MSFVLGAVIDLGGIITRRQTRHKSTRKVSSSIRHICPALPSAELSNGGKYLLERERLVKDNAWTLDT
jgi:hypothetical protein